MMAKAMGGRVIGVEPIEERRELSRELGADEVLDPAEADVAEAVRAFTRGEGADLSFETSGSTQGRTGAIDVLKFGGKAVYVGHGAQEPAINPSRFIGKQLTLMGSFVLPIPMYYDMVDFILDRGIELDHMITHRYELNAAKEAFRTFDSGRTGKVVFEWD
jgi:propanol-preferring alcohol dehydrogenase